MVDETVTEQTPPESPPPPNPIVPPSRPQSRSKGSSTGRPRGRPPGSTSGAPRKPKKPERKDYRPPILGVFQLAAAPCILAGQALKQSAFIADAAAITMHAPPIAEAINDLANEDPQVAAVLDRLLVIGPYGAVLAAALPLAAQVITNHRASVLTVTQAFGAVNPEQLIATLVEEVSVNGDKAASPTG